MPYGSAMKAKRKGQGHSLSQHLSSGATAMHTEVLLPRQWLDITWWWDV